MISVTLSYRRDIREPLVSMTLTATPQINNVSVLHVRHALWNIPACAVLQNKNVKFLRLQTVNLLVSVFLSTELSTVHLQRTSPIFCYLKKVE